jgi:hypothetical protein
LKLTRQEIRDLLLAGILMSLAWSLRGQFGHLKGGMIPGAMAAMIPILFLRGAWLASAGLALALSTLGFSLGGHMSYGRLVNYVEFHDILTCIPQLLRIFLIGGVWGGLGSTFLGYGVSEKPFTRGDFLLFSMLWFFWFITLGLLDLERVDILVLFAGFSILHLYNYRFKKSKLVFDFGFGGFLGFGGAFVFAVLLLNFGRHNWLPGPWHWWLLRDQIIGFLGGVTLWGIAQRSTHNKIQPSLANDLVTLHKIGIMFFAIMVPAVNSMNVILHWAKHRTFSQPEFFTAAILAFLFIFLFFYLVYQWEIFSIYLERTLLLTTLVFIWYMSAAAIVKEALIWGLSTWEAAYTLFIVFSAILTPFILLRLRETFKPKTSL